MDKVVKFFDYYTGVEKEDTLPSGNEYDFLLERNKNYMSNIALSFDKKKITFEELHERIDEYARTLYRRGVRKGDTIGVCLVNTPESVYVLYALIKLGAVIIGLSPLNNEYKMLRDIELTRPKMIISVDLMYSKFKKAVDDMKAEPILYSPLLSMNNIIIKLAYDAKQIIDGNKLFKKGNRLDKLYNEYRNTTNVEYPKYINNTCNNVMFTGGSTGVHKGVSLAGNRLNCVVKSLDHVLLLEPGMIHLGNIPFGNMCFGRLVLHYCLCKNVEYALTLKAMPEDFLSEMVRVHANGAMGGPVHWETLINNPNLQKDSLKELIQPLSGGELFKPKKLEQANAALRFAGCERDIGNGLGSTETWAPTHVCVGGKNRIGSTGYPLPFVKSKIVDPETFEELEDGKTGLLLVNGPGMMLGYYYNLEETEKVMYQEGDTTWYNTKDLAFKYPNGEYQFVGRLKRNFVSNVDNIYPEQIEQLLLQIPEINEVIVTPIPDEHEQFLPKYHISVLKKDFDKEDIENKIFTIIGSTLGESALPGYIEYYNKPLPRTENGKLNSSLLADNDLKEIKNNELVRTRFRGNKR